jgi:transposase
MAKALSEDLRARVVSAYESGEGSQQQIADRFGVGVATVGRWLKRFREEGELSPRPHGGGHEHKLDEVALHKLLGIVFENNDLTNEEYAAELVDRTGIAVSASTIVRAFKRLGLTRKKRRWSPKSVDVSGLPPGVNATFVGSSWRTRRG